MKKRMYLKLACVNLWKNRQSYLPYLLAATLLVFMLYTFGMLTFRLPDVMGRDAATASFVMMLGLIVIAVFSGIFLFYANSFLIKRRKRELGLYGILGLEKKHIGRVLFHETVLSALLSMAVGLGLGVLLGKLMVLLAAYLMRLPVPQVNTFSGASLSVTLILFAAFFGATLVYNLLQVHLSKPIELLRGGQQGEKEPKARWLIALIGAACLGWGYYLAQVVNNPAAAFAVFFLAVILVIIGTYLLFITGSIAVLKLLKKNKRIYYKSRNFITISGMLYRMKQNAAGLASICILSTMVMVTVGSTVAMFTGVESMLEESEPHDCRVTMGSPIDGSDFPAAARELARANHVEITAMYEFEEANHGMTLLDSKELVDSSGLSMDRLNDYGRIRKIVLMTQEDYNRAEGGNETLREREALYYAPGGAKVPEKLSYAGREITIRERLTSFALDRRAHQTNMPVAYLVVKDRAVAEDLIHQVMGNQDPVEWERNFYFDLSGAEKDRVAFAKELSGAVKAYVKENLKDPDSGYSYGTGTIDGNRNEWYAMYGGLLFVGIFLGLLFLIATTLIIYFKQVSEGYQDHDRFIILQKVGMSRREGKATVRRQIVTVFFLPLVVAVCHMAGAMNLIVQVLALFGLMDLSLIWGCMLLTAGVFGLLYFLVYHQTAKTYYQLVRC